MLSESRWPIRSVMKNMVDFMELFGNQIVEVIKLVQLSRNCVIIMEVADQVRHDMGNL